MDSWLLDKTLGVLVPVALGAIGWWVTNWLGNPLLKAYRLRSEAVELIFQTVNVGSTSDPDQVRDAQSRLRSLAARLLATHASAIAPVRALLRLLCLDLIAAANASLALSNSFTEDDGSRAIHRRDIEVALALQQRARRDEDAYVAAVKKGLSGRG
jgi:hypothetical protein